MSRKTDDPLLKTVALVLHVLVWLHAFAMIVVAIMLGAVLTIHRSEIVSDIAAKGLAADTYWAIVTVRAGVVAILFLGLRFTIELKRIVASVGDGDPFIADNATRLSHMAWLTLARYLIAFPVSVAAAATDELAERFSIEFDATGGVVIVFTLFILARVFRTGTEMREELEGVV